jgi:uncharacterized protein (DUF2336 family)
MENRPMHCPDSENAGYAYGCRDMCLAGSSLFSVAGQRLGQNIRKASLLAEVARDFCDSDRPTLEETARFKEMFYQFIDACDRGQRRALASSLSRFVYTPRQVLIYLALDDLDVAAPVLLFADGLNEADIVILARRLPLQHLKVACRRHDLTPAAVAALIRAGGEECAEIIAANPAARGSMAAASVVAEDLMQETATDKIAAVEVAAPAEDRVRGTLTAELMTLAGRGGRLGGARRSSAAVSTLAIDADLECLLLFAARQGGTEMAAETMAGHCGLPKDACLRLLNEADCDALCAVFVGFGLGVVPTLQMLQMLGRDVAGDRQRFERARRLARRLDRAACRSCLEQVGACFTELGNRRAGDRPQNRREKDAPPRRQTLRSEMTDRARLGRSQTESLSSEVDRSKRVAAAF